MTSRIDVHCTVLTHEARKLAVFLLLMQQWSSECSSDDHTTMHPQEMTFFLVPQATTVTCYSDDHFTNFVLLFPRQQRRPATLKMAIPCVNQNPGHLLDAVMRQFLIVSIFYSTMHPVGIEEIDVGGSTSLRAVNSVMASLSEALRKGSNSEKNLNIEIPISLDVPVLDLQIRTTPDKSSMSDDLQGKGIILGERTDLSHSERSAATNSEDAGIQTCTNSVLRLDSSKSSHHDPVERNGSHHEADVEMGLPTALYHQ